MITENNMAVSKFPHFEMEGYKSVKSRVKRPSHATFKCTRNLYTIVQAREIIYETYEMDSESNSTMFLMNESLAMNCLMSFHSVNFLPRSKTRDPTAISTGFGGVLRALISLKWSFLICLTATNTILFFTKK